jgi:hypothetical protein
MYSTIALQNLTNKCTILHMGRLPWRNRFAHLLKSKPPSPSKTIGAAYSSTPNFSPDRAPTTSPSSLPDRAKFIPLRLSSSERKLLHLLEASLSLSEYTNKVDTMSNPAPYAKRVITGIEHLCSLLKGLGSSLNSEHVDYPSAEGDAIQNNWLVRVFEIGRRYKMMNPDK